MVKYLIVLPFLLAASFAQAEPVEPGQLELARKYVQMEMHMSTLSTPNVDQTEEDWARAMKNLPVGEARPVARYLPGLLIIAPYFKAEWEMPWLIHEMVHHAQLYSGRSYSCVAAKEREAYEIQNKFSVQFGYQGTTVSETFIEAHSRCR